MFHITPVNDIFDHQDSSTCHCCPRIEQHDGNVFCIHNAYDGRHYIKRAISDPSLKNSNQHLSDFFTHLDELTYINGAIDEAKRTEILSRTIGELIYELRELVPPGKSKDEPEAEHVTDANDNSLFNNQPETKQDYEETEQDRETGYMEEEQEEPDQDSSPG